MKVHSASGICAQYACLSNGRLPSRISRNITNLANFAWPYVSLCTEHVFQAIILTHLQRLRIRYKVTLTRTRAYIHCFCIAEQKSEYQRQGHTLRQQAQQAYLFLLKRWLPLLQPCSILHWGKREHHKWEHLLPKQDVDMAPETDILLCRTREHVHTHIPTWTLVCGHTWIVVIVPIDFITLVLFRILQMVWLFVRKIAPARRQNQRYKDMIVPVNDGNHPPQMREV